MGKVIPFRAAGQATNTTTGQGTQDSPWSLLGILGVSAGLWIGWEVLKAWASDDYDDVPMRLPRGNSRRR